MTGPIARILLRYVAMSLVAHGWLTSGDANILATDPDLQMLVGALLAAGVEGWYWLAKRLNWNT